MLSMGRSGGWAGVGWGVQGIFYHVVTHALTAIPIITIENIRQTDGQTVLHDTTRNLLDRLLSQV